MDNVRNIIFGIYGIVIYALGTYAVVTIGGPMVGGVIRGYEQMREIDRFHEEARLSSRERHFEDICPLYAEASTWERWTNRAYWDLSWCKDYLHRLPVGTAELQIDPVDFIVD